MDKIPLNPAILSSGETLDYGWRLFDHLATQIQNADTKASLIMGVDAILIGALVKVVADNVTSLSAHLYAIPYIASVILHGAALFLLGGSIYTALIVTRPETSRTKDTGLFYFAMIRNFSREEFIKNFENLTPEQIRHDLLSQVHTLAHITQRKYRRIATSLNLLLACLFSWGIAELITILG